MKIQHRHDTQKEHCKELRTLNTACSAAFNIYTERLEVLSNRAAPKTLLLRSGQAPEVTSLQLSFYPASSGPGLEGADKAQAMPIASCHSDTLSLSS